MDHQMAGTDAASDVGLEPLVSMFQEAGGRLAGGHGPSSGSSRTSNHLLKQLQSRVEAAAQEGKPLSPLEGSLMRALSETLGNTTLPAVKKGHEDDQREMNRIVQALTDCNSNYAKDSKSAESAKQMVDTKKQEHQYCRGNQSVLKGTRDKKMEDLKSFTDSLQQPQKPMPVDPAAADSYFAAGLQWFKENQALYTNKKSAYSTAKAEHDRKTETCNAAQTSYETGYCQWIGQGTAASKSYTRCWTQGGGDDWNQTRAMVLDSSGQRKLEYVAVKKIQCFLSSLLVRFKKVGKVVQKNIDACKALMPDTSIFDLVNTDAPPKQTLSSLGNLTSMPGDDTWQKSEYAQLSDVKNVTPCAQAVDENDTLIWKGGNITHLCGVNEHVRMHRCEPCAPGKSHPEGDNAFSADTTCSAILCDANQHVAQNMCETCSAGMRNAAGDDASGPNTSCAAIMCQAGQRVQNNSCHSCPAGTKNEAGGHDASGADTSCDPIKCPANHFVKASACHTCPAGKTNAAGDDATKGDTTCDATKCAANKKVVSNECKGCPPGRHNAAGDDASGADTKCHATKCGKNQRVVGNACIACPDGTSNQPGDDASGSDTTCTPIRCGANQHVVSKACQPCPAGQINEAGDDASGSNTACEQPCGKEPSSCSWHITWATGSGQHHGDRGRWYPSLPAISGKPWGQATREEMRQSFYCDAVWKTDCNDKGLTPNCDKHGKAMKCP
eukprot:TRINITY_DN23116_c0_g1_i1.p1 TRINITY_DN23116_c0_g1~~TRINITY_DN23116_c0_g1_i1.p1  ORF type:complete len:724 (+),score=117.26 TRINITY_DN23116_c0_g1_i1:413-2584(+)